MSDNDLYIENLKNHFQTRLCKVLNQTTQAEFCKKTGIKETTLQGYLGQKGHLPDGENFLRIISYNKDPEFWLGKDMDYRLKKFRILITLPEIVIDDILNQIRIAKLALV